MGKYEKRKAIIIRIDHVGADISCVQETHGDITTTSNMEGYVTYPGQAETKPTTEEEKTQQNNDKTMQQNHENAKR